MTRKYPFITQIASIAHFWNSVGPIYSPKKSCKPKTLSRWRPGWIKPFCTFSHRKSSLFRKNFFRPQTNFQSGKKGRFGGFDNQRIKSDSQNPKDKTWPKFCCTVLSSPLNTKPLAIWTLGTWLTALYSNARQPRFDSTLQRSQSSTELE